MKVALVATVVAFLATPAFSQEMVASDGKDEIRLTLNACPASVLARIPEQFHSRFMEAKATIGGQKYVACWARRDPMIHVVYEDGDQGLIPQNQFSRGA